ncbi:MAG: 2-deoxyribonucleoside glycosidase [Spirochaetae bacterium HGW-Spirochaetae-1]|jgi:nucleoside 2-deoxyribosyltransferase|nr:MAG: 2-deoxyribonucleoside glycosidase [Spirochaetae bacterium HGW-Spirochaetae-1]
MIKKKLYIASPLGFSESGRFFLYERIIPLVKECGLDVLDPWTLTDSTIIAQAQAKPPGREREEAWLQVNRIIGKNNETAIDTSQGVFAVLDGSDVDSGTAAEIGYAAARGKIIIGYRSDFRLAGDNEGSVINLQVEYFIHRSGGRIVASLEEAGALLRSMF